MKPKAFGLITAAGAQELLGLLVPSSDVWEELKCSDFHSIAYTL